MGSRGAGSGRKGAFNTLPDSTLTAGKPTAKSKEVFDRVYSELRSLAKDNIERGDLNSGGYNTLHSDYDEPVYSKPTLRGIQTLIDSEWKSLNVSEKLKIGSFDNIQIKKYAITMMQKMVNKYYNNNYGG